MSNRPNASTQAPYLGLVGTRCIQPSSMISSRTEIMSVRIHRATDNIKTFQAVLPNYYTGGGGEIGIGPGTFTMGVEYPVGSGSIAQFEFGGTSQAIAPNASVILTDPRSIDIKDGSLFASRIYYTNPNGILYSDIAAAGAATGFPEGALSGTAISDQTMSGTVAFNDPVSTFGAVGFIAQTTKPTVFAFGDSRVAGLFDTVDASGDAGEIARSLSPFMACTNFGVPSDQLALFLANSALRRSIAQYCSHVVTNLGGADVNGSSRTAAQMFADLKSVRALFPTQPFFPMTSVPQTTSSDGFTTSAGQTVYAYEARRVGLNNLIRTMENCIDLSDVVEDGYNSGKWAASARAVITADGIHENQEGNLFIARSRVIRPEMFRQ